MKYNLIILMAGELRHYFEVEIEDQPGKKEAYLKYLTQQQWYITDEVALNLSQAIKISLEPYQDYEHIAHII